MEMYYQKERHTSCKDTSKLSQLFFREGERCQPMHQAHLDTDGHAPRNTLSRERESNAPRRQPHTSPDTRSLNTDEEET
ncbi:hypothetical protein CEXT_210681 [Caerostris extrusa]|uniref:Uncharacterized protein n=1 Tax=Caerostris extrusa TaxID=172846 RepID=A0AAV4XIN5_CAEEX|nr:hypothetical protein CEXT_210681 [Caerostris extrusa]